MRGVALLGLCAWLSLAQPQMHQWETQTPYAQIKVSAYGDGVTLSPVMDSVLPWLERFSATYSGKGPLDSVLFSAKPGQRLLLDSTSRELLRFGLGVRQQTGGEIDLGIGNLLRAWGIGWGQQSRVPSPAELQGLVEELRFPFAHFAGDTLVVDRTGRHIAMGSYLEGRMLEEMSHRLDRAGCSSYLIDVGGDFAVAGRKPNGQPWTLGIKDPAQPDSLIAVVRMDNPRWRGLSTSGDYEQRFTDAKGKRHHHIFDPRTGQSSQGVRSATVVSVRPMLNDAYDTWFMLLPLERMRSAVAEAGGDVEAFVVLDGGRVWISPGLRGSVHMLSKAYQVLP